MHIERTIDLPASPARIWTLLTDPEQVAHWVTELVSDEPITPPPTGVGTRTRMKIRERSRIVEYATELLVFTPGSELVLEMRGGNLGAEPMVVSYRLSPIDGGTRLVYRCSWRPRGILLYMLLPLIILVGRRNLRRTLARLAAHAAEPPPRLATSCPA